MAGAFLRGKELRRKQGHPASPNTPGYLSWEEGWQRRKKNDKIVTCRDPDPLQARTWQGEEQPLSFSCHLPPMIGFSVHYVWGAWVTFCPWTEFMPCSVLIFRANTGLSALCAWAEQLQHQNPKTKNIHIQCIWLFSLSTPNSTLMLLVFNVYKKCILHNGSVQKLKTTVNYSSHSFSPSCCKLH